MCFAQLWMYAAYAPVRPTPKEQQHLRVFYEQFPDQCTSGPAANCYSETILKFPPRVKSRRDLMLWLCIVENACRRRAGISPKLCQYNELCKRWRLDEED
eukprot:GHVT01011703.1.p2 GENE.GHVT01011703.1~~GHVT01011703.1.p2  ORF type:complete len:100 (-),score=10.64 GHVT01011703.1:990-1289(-)